MSVSEAAAGTWEVVQQLGRVLRFVVPSDLEGLEDPANADPQPAAAAFASMRPSPDLDAAFARLRGSHAGPALARAASGGRNRGHATGEPTHGERGADADQPTVSTSDQAQSEAREAISSYQNAGEQWSSLSWVPPEAPGPLDATQALALQHHCARLQERVRQQDVELRRKEREIDRLNQVLGLNLLVREQGNKAAEAGHTFTDSV